jgi:hypothetical protein
VKIIDRNDIQPDQLAIARSGRASRAGHKDEGHDDEQHRCCPQPLPKTHAKASRRTEISCFAQFAP